MLRIFLFTVAIACLAGDGHAILAQDRAPKTQMSLEEQLAQKLLTLDDCLDLPISVEWSNCPLDRACKELADAFDVDILLDRKALRELKVESNAPVTHALKSIPARKILSEVLKQVSPDLVPVPKHGLLIITSDERSASTRVYSLKGLAAFTDKPAPTAEQVRDHLRTLAPESWKAKGGIGVVEAYGDSVVVYHKAHGQWRANNYMRSLRAQFPRADIELGRVPDEVVAQKAVMVAKKKGLPWTAGRTLDFALNELSSAEFVDTPLKDVCFFLTDAHGFPIAWDESIPDLERFRDTPVSLRANRRYVPIHLILDNALSFVELPLVVVIKERGLLVTTEPDTLSTVRYDIHELLEAAAKRKVRLQPRAEAERIRELLLAAVAPGTWKAAGGLGTAEVEAEHLVVQQDSHIHWQVRDFLFSLRNSELPSREEFATTVEERVRARALATIKHFDTDHDGILSPDEYEIRGIDANKDGQATAQELVQYKLYWEARSQIGGISTARK